MKHIDGEVMLCNVIVDGHMMIEDLLNLFPARNGGFRIMTPEAY
jgi:hypothetical protein